MNPPDEPPASLLGALAAGGRPLAVLLLGAALVKGLCILAALDGNPLAHLATSDSAYYLDRARGLAGVADDPLAGETYHLPPLYPIVLALVPGALEGRFGGVMVVQALGGIVLLAGVWLLASRRLSRPAAWLAVALALAYGPLTFFETKLLGDSLATVLLVSALVACDRVADRRGPWPALVAGLAVGGACLARPQALLLVPLLTAWMGRGHGLRPAIAFLVSAVAVVAPATVHNVRASGDLVLVSDNGGINLWLAQTGPPSGTFLTVDEDFGDIDDQAEVARQRAEAATGRRMTAGEVSRHFARRAMGAALDNPVNTLNRIALRALALIESFETGVVTVPEVEGRLVGPLSVLALPFGVLAGLAVLGLLLGGPPRRAPWFPAAALTVMVVVTTLAFFHYSRFRLPLVPVLAVLAASSWDRLAGPARAGAEAPPPPSPTRVAMGLAAAIGLAALSLLPQRHHPNALANGWTSLAEARLALARPGDRAAAERAYEEATVALEHQDGFVRAQLAAARAALALDRFDAADRWLSRAEATAPDHAPLMLLRAGLLLRRHPGNRHHDLARAEALLARLAVRARLDPSLAGPLAAMEQELARQRG